MFTPPPRYALAVLAELVRLAGPALNQSVEASDDAIMAATGYSHRSVRLAFQRIADAGAAQVARRRDGKRTIALIWNHPWVRIASTVAEVAS